VAPSRRAPLGHQISSHSLSGCRYFCAITWLRPVVPWQQRRVVSGRGVADCCRHRLIAARAMSATPKVCGRYRSPRSAHPARLALLAPHLNPRCQRPAQHARGQRPAEAFTRRRRPPRTGGSGRSVAGYPLRVGREAWLGSLALRGSNRANIACCGTRPPPSAAAKCSNRAIRHRPHPTHASFRPASATFVARDAPRW